MQGTLAGEDTTPFQVNNLTPWVSSFSKSPSKTTEHSLYRLAAKLVKLSS